MEIVLVPKKNVPSQYPGLYLFTGPARMMRPVKNLTVDKVELIGTFEQVYLDVCVTPEEAHEGVNFFFIKFIVFISLLIAYLLVNDSSRTGQNSIFE